MSSFNFGSDVIYLLSCLWVGGHLYYLSFFWDLILMETAKLGEEFKVETAVAENNKYKLVLKGEKQGMLKIVG
ncbi:hypothetical protein SDJN02_19536, partial [Cucurbita argyrosperma subsp. argyrosperma]